MSLNKLVVGIVRSSGKSEDGTTLDRQQLQIQNYCNANKLLQPYIIVDHNKSGFKANRKGLTELKELCEAGKVSHVIFVSLDRLVRSLKLGLELQALFERKSITFISLSEKIDTSNASTKFQFQIMLSLAECYRNSISDKMRNCIAHKRSKGEAITPILPYGYSKNEKLLVPHPKEQEVIKLMLELYSNEYKSYLDIARTLNAKEIPTKTNKGKWSYLSVRRVLEREIAKLKTTNVA